MIAYIGFNDKGVGLCLNTLPAPSRRVGVPHYFIVRAILEAASLDEAVDAVRRAERAIPANVMLITPQGPADLEITIDDVQVLRSNDSSPVTHTNHCLHPNLLPINEEFPELIQSHDRIHRIGELLNTNGEGFRSRWYNKG
ncbi:MAG: C45 family autoproteolytic acyltransferase/hydrolase [Planctomycetaceae bacterium]